MTAPAPLDALADRPELVARPAAGRLDPAMAGAAWRSGSGAVLLCWPGHRARPTFMSRTSSGGLPHGRLELLAGCLSAEDVGRAADTWDSRLEVEECRDRRGAAVAAVAADRARTRSALLRAMRRGEPPPGSCSLAAHFEGRGVEGAGEVWPVVRFPDGRGWWPTEDEEDPERWPWEENKPDAVLRVLAAGLSEVQCWELAALRPADVEAALRRMEVA